MMGHIKKSDMTSIKDLIYLQKKQLLQPILYRYYDEENDKLKGFNFVAFNH